jgi:hypothetical protein
LPCYRHRGIQEEYFTTLETLATPLFVVYDAVAVVTAVAFAATV